MSGSLVENSDRLGNWCSVSIKENNGDSIHYMNALMRIKSAMT